MMHLRLMEDARDALYAVREERKPNWITFCLCPALTSICITFGQRNKAVIGGFMVPVHEAYGKRSLVSMVHRVNM